MTCLIQWATKNGDQILSVKVRLVSMPFSRRYSYSTHKNINQRSLVSTERVIVKPKVYQKLKLVTWSTKLHNQFIYILCSILYRWLVHWQVTPCTCNMFKKKTHVGSDPLTVYVKSVPILTSLLFPRWVIHTLDYPPIMPVHANRTWRYKCSFNLISSTLVFKVKLFSRRWLLVQDAD